MTTRLTLAALISLLAACGATSPGGPDDAGQVSDGGLPDADGGTGPRLDGLCDGGCALPDGGYDQGGGSPDAGACSGTPGTHLRTLYIGGMLRVWYEHVPATYDCHAALPVVISFHGFSSNAPEQMALGRLNAKADSAGFIAVHPEGLWTPQSWNAGSCCGNAGLLGTDDVAFTRAMVANLAQRYAVDAKRVFALGMSNGGFFSHRLGCDASDLVAAIAPVAGVMGMPSCHPTRRVPVLDFHGTADDVVPYEGGTLTGFLPVATSMSDWARRNGCGTATTVVFQKGDATCKAWQGCAADVQLCTLDGGGHTWPGGMPVPGLGKTSTDLSATDRAWDFFVAHPMP